MITTYIGVVGGLHTWEVRNESGTVIGMNQSAYPPCPGDEYVWDESALEWVKA